jgi:hypothetical protein
MPDLVATRTLVKSPPELWAELSEAEGLGRHLGEFGEIKVNRLEPEAAIVWEAHQVCGTVEIEATGWGTKVVLTADLPATHGEKAVLEPEPDSPRAAEASPRRPGGFFSRWLFRKRRRDEPSPREPVDAEQVREATELPQRDSPIDEKQARIVLEDALDTLGSAHHRPFSRG